MRRLIVTTITLILALTLTIDAQTPMRVTAKIDDQGKTTFGRFSIPVGSVGTDFIVEMRTQSPTIGLSSRPSVAITSAGGDTVFFTRKPTSDGFTNDAPLPLDQLILQPGSYEVRPGGGRRTYVAVELTVAVPTVTAGVGEITALLDSNCIQQEASLTVPAGMKAINLHIITAASGLPCQPGTLAPPMSASIEGPSFSYRWSKNRRTGTADEWPAPIGTFELQPGIYTLRTGQGKLSRTKLSYEIVPLAELGDTVTRTLPPALWEPVTEGTGSAWVEGNNLRIDSIGAGSAWFRTPRPYDFDSDYTVELELRVNVENGHWTWVYSDGFIVINTDWGLDLSHYQPGLPWSTKVFARLTQDRWYRLRIEASPENKRFEVYSDGGLAGTATGIEPQMSHVHGQGFGNSDPDVIYLGDADSLAYRGGSYNHGNISVRAIRVTGASPADSPSSASEPDGPLDGLVAYYPLDGDAKDKSGNGHHGAGQGSVGYGPGAFGQAADLTPGGSYIDCGDFADARLTGPFTISAWIKVGTYGPSHWNNTIVAKEDWVPPRGQTYGYVLRTGASGVLSLVIANSSTVGSWLEVASTPLMEVDVWHHVVGMYTGSQMKIFVDGDEVGSKETGPIAIDYSAVPLLIGRSPNRSDRREYSGFIDEVRVYNRALTSTEVQKLQRRR